MALAPGRARPGRGAQGERFTDRREPGIGREETVMQVREIMTGALVSVPPDTPVLDARHLMLEKRIRHLLVTGKNGDLQGIVTDRDIRLNLPSQATSLSVWEVNYLLTKLAVSAVMTKAVITIGPDAPVRTAAQMMLDKTIGALPVVDGGRLVGIVTESDILRAFVKAAEMADVVRRP